MSMILFEGRKEDAYRKFQKSIDAERDMLSTYMDDASAYDFLLDDPFMIETNYKYLNDILEYYYSVNYYSGEPITKDRDSARNSLFAIRREIETLIEYLKLFETHKSKFKYPEFRKYLPYLQEFFQEAKKIKDEVENKKKEESAKKGGVKIFEDNRLLIVKPTTYEASCSYGAGTKWCTTMANQPSYFNQYSSNGNLYYLILKGVDRSNKFYKMAIHIPKHKDFDTDSVWYDASDERLTSREKESVLAHMPKEAYSAMAQDFQKSFPEENVIDILQKVMPQVRGVSLESEYPFKGGKIIITIDSPDVEESEDNSVAIGSLFGVSVEKDGKEIRNESGVINCTIEPYQAQVLLPQYYILRADIEIFGFDRLDIVQIYKNTETIQVQNSRKTDPDYLKSVMEKFINTINNHFKYKIERRLQTDEDLIEKYPPMKAKSYTNAGYTFTGKGNLTKAFMTYLKNLPEGKAGSKNEFLTKLGRKTGPGSYSSFFSALAQAGITARQGRSGLVKGVNFDKFYKKVFE